MILKKKNQTEQTVNRKISGFRAAPLFVRDFFLLTSPILDNRNKYLSASLLLMSESKKFDVT